jgi:amino acid transporter/nucleotide-binding universal stress UspA family protein
MSIRKTEVKVTLSRDLSAFDITMIGVGAMIGAGIFVLTGHAAGAAGPAFLVAFLLNGVVTLFTAASYAELGSAFPQAGGGYVWIQKGLSPFFGFIGGWMDWFAHSLACSLYALGFGSYAADLLYRSGLTVLGMEPDGERGLSVALAVAVAIVFTFINYLGTSETGAVGNIVTMTKVVILATFAAFGLAALFRVPHWTQSFVPFAPQGTISIISAMGLTTIAFQGYEVIAQCGEEVENPKRNLPVAIFAAIGIVVIIYLAVGFVALGAIDLGKFSADARASLPVGIDTTWEFLAHFEETAIVEAARQVMPFGAYILLFAGLVSTISALNATIYSSSRVSFAMGRDCNLPPFFGKIDPRRRTPATAIFISGSLVVLMVTALPIKDVASAADIMFLMLFAMVNLTAIRLRKLRPDLDRGYKVPLMPLMPILGITFQALLALSLFRLSPIAWFTTVLWIGAGLVFYLAYARTSEAMEEPELVLHEEIVTVRRHSLIFPLDRKTRVERLMPFVSAWAQENEAEILALHVVRVPAQLSIRQGRMFLAEGKDLLERVIAAAKEAEVPVHSMIRLGRDEVKGIFRTARRRRASLMVLDWRGYTRSRGRIFGHVIDRLVDNPPCDVVVVNHKGLPHTATVVDGFKRILVPASGGPHAALAASLAAQLGVHFDARVTMLNICTREPNPEEQKRRLERLKATTEGIDFPFEYQVLPATDTTEGILAQAVDYDLVLVGATRRRPFDRILFGNISERLAAQCPKTVIMVKRRDPLEAILRRIRPGVPTEPPVEATDRVAA